MSPKGIASPNLKTGRYSRYLPSRLVEKVREAERDPELLSVRSEVALLQGRISEIVSRLYSGESGSLWKQLKETWVLFEGANEAKDTEAIKVALDSLRSLIYQGTQDEASWGELVRLIDAKTRTTQAEWKRLVDMRQVMTAERVTAFALTVLDCVTRHLDRSDPKRTLIAGDIMNLINQDVREPVGVARETAARKAALEVIPGSLAASQPEQENREGESGSLPLPKDE